MKSDPGTASPHTDNIKTQINTSNTILRHRSSSSSVARLSSIENIRTSDGTKPRRDSSPSKSFGEFGGLREHKLDIKALQFSISSTVPVHSSTEKEFTAFLVTITLPNKEQRTLLRRYRQFAALHHAVQNAYPDVVIPRFPKKRFIGNMGNHVIEKRRVKLEEYIKFVITLPDIEELLGFETFLGADLIQRGKKPKKGQKQTEGLVDDEEDKESDREREIRM